MQALQTPDGLVFRVEGSEPNKRQLCIAALSAAKRELLPDVPEMLDLIFKPVPHSPNEVAIIRLKPNGEAD